MAAANLFATAASASGVSDLGSTIRGTKITSSVGALKLKPDDIQLGRSIAPGAFAEVFRGILWGQKVAVKRLFTDRPGADAASLRAELLHETRLLAAMSHPCILMLIGYSDVPAQIVLEVLDGTVYDMVKAGSHSSLDGGLLSPLLDVLSGCAYLHARSPPIVHRDLKPPNVLHDERNRCKLCDFGTALELAEGTPLPTEWVGSALYVAPEVDKEQPYGLAADVFSFGVLAYELYHLAESGYDFYGEGMDLFDEGGVVEGLRVVREPLLKEPQEMPPRPGSCESDEVWELLCACMKQKPEERPGFAEVASKVGAIRQKGGGALSKWL